MTAEVTGPRVVVLSDDKPGHLNQSKAIVQALGLPSVIETISYGKDNRFYGLLVKAWLSLLPGIGPVLARQFLKGHVQPAKALFLGTGTLVLPLLVMVKRAWGCRVVAVMAHRPFSLNAFDLVIRHQLGDLEPRPGTTLVLGAPALPRSDQEAPPFLEEVGKALGSGPSLALLIGGPLAWQGNDPHPFLDLITQMGQTGLPIGLTTSRRTPPDIESALEALAAPFQLIASKQPGNPIPALLQTASVVVVSGESISMISEALNAGAKVLAVKVWNQEPQGRGRKFASFLAHLEKEGYLWLCEPGKVQETIQTILQAAPPHPFPQSAKQAADAVRSLL